MESRIFLIVFAFLCISVVIIEPHPRHHHQHSNDHSNDNKLLNDYSDEVVSELCFPLSN